MINLYIRDKGITKCPPRAAKGADYYKKTASAYGTPESFEYSHSRESATSALAKAKLLTMIQDLALPAMCNPSEKIRLRSDAYRFFFSEKERQEFENWCDDAGFDPEYIREQARDIYENGPRKWRADPGTSPTYEKRKHHRLRMKHKVAQ